MKYLNFIKLHNQNIFNHQIGGYDGAWKRKVDQFSVATKTWLTGLNLLPVAKMDSSGISVSGRLFMIGGRAGNVLEWDEATDTWSEVADIPGFTVWKFTLPIVYNV